MDNIMGLLKLLLGGGVGALLAIFLTPRFQHYFWKRQKREEIRLGIVTDVNRLAAEFKSTYLFKDHVETTSECTLTFTQSWLAVTGQVKDLFSHLHINHLKGCIPMSLQPLSTAPKK